MTTAPGGQEIVIGPDGPAVATMVAARLVVAISDALSLRDTCHVALTGGGIGTSSLAAVTHEPAIQGIDWSRVHFWWSDERFEPEGSELRNETGARAALLDHLPIDPSQIHPMPASDGPWGDDVDAAAAGYAAELAEAAQPGDELPAFDVAMLGVGPDGHVASIFPEQPELLTAPGIVIPIRNSPKPPPTRISLTLPAICQARQVWLIASGVAKAEAMAEALFPKSDPPAVSAGRVHGSEHTLALLDSPAASALP